jgi:hypothetical protein
MLAPEDRPAVARVLRISSPSQDTSTPPTTRPSKSRTESAGLSVDKDGLTKKQRQNQKKKERHREARAREEAARQEQLRAHQKQLETIRLNTQIKAAEKRSTQSAWQRSDPPSLQESVYTVQNLSDENLTTVGHPSDGAASEEGWQEVTSKAAKRAAQKSSEKSGSGTDGSEESLSVGDTEEGKTSQTGQPYASSNMFANLNS